MSKQTVTRLFIGGGAAIVVGGILAIASVSIAMANDLFVMNGSDIVAVRGGAMTWSLLALAIVGCTTMAAGLIAGLAAWIGALAITWQLQSRTWFVALLLLGIFNLGFFAMVAYVVAGPDGTADTTSRTGQPAARATPA